MVKIIVFLPLIGFLFAFLFGRQVGARTAQVVTIRLAAAAVTTPCSAVTVMTCWTAAMMTTP